MNNAFKTRYNALNDRQKEAVDAIYGPVMVVAGPGTGKTELLSVRTANILQKTDTLPSSILCLTFTDSAAANMRERLVGLMGAEGYKVAIHTFHSFGSEVMNRYSQFFYHGAHFRPADELSTHEILTELLQKLPHDNPLASTMNGAFTYLKDVQQIISEMKRSGYTPDELNIMLDRNDAFCSWIQPRINEVFGPTMSKKQFPQVQSLLDEIDAYDEESIELLGYHALYTHTYVTLSEALQESIEQDSTKPLSAWKKAFIVKNKDGEQTLKDGRHAEKLRAAVQIYYEYLIAMQEKALYDYDDMILRVVHAMEVFNELRFELQETYQFIMVDEFQDTNQAQMRMLANLTTGVTPEDTPNVLVVGDDDQAIYRFQGADMSNILDFTSLYPSALIVTLTDNYRSGRSILDTAQQIVKNIEERLETRMPSIDKTLIDHFDKPHSVQFDRYRSETDARYNVAQSIAEGYKSDSSMSRAIIGRNHRHLLALLPHLEAKGIPVRYDLQENCLDSEPVQQLEIVARVVVHLSLGEYEDANALLPEMLSHPAWGIKPRELWQLGISATKARRFWLEEMLDAEGKLQQIAEWLIISAHFSLTMPLETMIDMLFGVTDAQTADTQQVDEIEERASVEEEYISPLRAYFFPSESLETMPTQYIVWLHTLQQLRARLREYRPGTDLRLNDFVHFIEMHRDAGLRMQAKTSIEHDESAVTLLTAHKSKGLEFDEVYIVDAHDNVWGNGAHTRSRLIQFPSNMPLSPAGDSNDERVRLLFVAATRAKASLKFITSTQLDTGKAILPVAALSSDTLEIIDHDTTAKESIEALNNDWRHRALDVALTTKQQVLRPLLSRYKLSATHLNNFLNIPNGGPELFLLHNLLRFPQAMSPSAAYGSAVHAALQRAHAHLSATNKKRPVEDVLNDFEAVLGEFQLSDTERTLYTGRGTAALTSFLTAKYDTFSQSQIVERSFRGEDIVVNGAHITGAIDLIDIDDNEKTIFITDYKTGKAASSWRGSSEYEKIKLHHYEQQLMMYKLLIDGSEQFRGYTVTGARLTFVEPSSNNKIVELDYTYDNEKLAEFQKLLAAVWQQIQSLNFEATSEYDPSFKGILEFESDLLK
jgi:DNA helicase-2/ATP-dependent DNA helicase PcrA